MIEREQKLYEGMNMNNREQVSAIQRYKIGYHTDEWGMRSGTPTGIHDASGSWVRYSDHVAVIATLRAQQVRITEPEAEIVAVQQVVCGMDAGLTQTTEQERAEFEAQFKHLDLTQEPDAWGVPRYKHAAIWLAWEAWQASRRTQVVPDDVEKLREELAEEADAANNWRRLALQFDNHRLHAIWHLKRVLHPHGGQDERDHAEEFLKAPPLDGEAVLAERIAALAAAPQPPVGVVPQWDGVIKSSDFIVDTFRGESGGWNHHPDDCVRITHRPTGFFEEESASRSVHTNRAVAWQRMVMRLESLATAYQTIHTEAIPAPLDRERIREIFMPRGFTVKEGHTDLKQYVYDAAEALLRVSSESVMDDTKRYFFDAGWKACANFCDRDDVRFDGIVGQHGCPQFEDAFRAARKQGSDMTDKPTPTDADLF